MNRNIKAPSFSKLFLGIMTLVAGLSGTIEAHAQFGGVPLWTNRYDGPADPWESYDGGRAIVVDGNGNVFVTGHSENGTSADYVTLKYSRSGLPLWTNRYDGGGNDEAHAMAVDASGNVIVTGYSPGIGSSDDYATIKYSNAGVPMWTNRYNGPANSKDQASNMALDASGNVFVTGNSRGDGSLDDYATIKYSNAGVPMWTNRYNGPGNGQDIAQAVAVDASGNVIVTGFSDGGGSNSWDYATIKYSNAGIPLWTNRYDRGADSGIALAVDGSSKVFVTGSSQATGGPQAPTDACVTIAYSSAGVPLWTNLYAMSGSSIAVDASGTVFVTGTSYATIAYSNAGIPLWTNHYSGPANTYDYAWEAKVDSSGNVFVTGESPGIDTDTDYATIKYSNAGVPLWTNRYSGFGSASTDMAVRMAVDSSGNVFVTGISASTDAYDYDIATIAYSGADAPSLTISRTPTNTIVVTWPSYWTGFTLQQNANDISPSNWSNIVDVPIDGGANKVIILTPASGNRFYRLARP